MQDFQLYGGDGRIPGCGGVAANAGLPHLVEELDALVAEIEGAAEGNRSLDARIHFGLRLMAGRGEDIAALLIGEGISWPTVDAALSGTIPPYTTSLDAALEGERILFVLCSTSRSRWCAMQKAAGSEILAWAATEPLARRLAALKGWRAEIAAAENAGREACEATAFASRRNVAVVSPLNASGAEAENTLMGDGARDAKDWEVLF